jgi:peptidoglycan/LPS O-acetylase OafA/YrhL
MKKTENWLSSYDGNRHNNFTLIRILFAWAVLYGHAFVLQKTTGISDPLNIIFKGSTSIGTISVCSFFAISGYLVTASYIKRGFIDYTISRILRIFPALTVCVLISTFLLGLAVTNLDSSSYLSDKRTYSYLVNIIGFWKIEFNLPEVFTENYKNSVNGSLWTIIVELRCYILLAILGLFGLLTHKITANFTLLALLLFGIEYFSDLPLLGIGIRGGWPVPSLYFLIGIFFYINREHINLDFRLAVLAVIILYASFGQKWYLYVSPLSSVYLIFYVAYSTPFINLDKKIGDISYGIYIYAFPLQQVVASLFPDFRPFENCIFSTVIVFPIAYLSWHYIEKPILNLKLTVTNLKNAKALPFKKLLFSRIFTKTRN